MIQSIMRITLIVREQEEAFRFYTEKLGFEKRADQPMGAGARWLTLAPPGQTELEMVLQPPDWFEGEARKQHLAQVGKNPALVLRVDNCRQTYAQLKERGVPFSAAPEEVGWGVQAVAQDLYGNSLVLLEPRLPPGRDKAG